MCNNSHSSFGPPVPIDDAGAAIQHLAFAVSSEGALDFVKKLQVRESDWEVADKHACVVWVVAGNDTIDL